MSKDWIGKVCIFWDKGDMVLSKLQDYDEREVYPYTTDDYNIYKHCRLATDKEIECYNNIHKEDKDNDPVNHPAHYTSNPSGIECIDVTRNFNFDLGNAIKYIWRAGLKGNAVEDLEKAIWYLQDEIKRISK